MQYLVRCVFAALIFLPVAALSEEPAPLRVGLIAPLRVGLIAPLTGPAAAYGNAGKNGFQMGLDELPKGSLEVVYEDDQYSAAKTVAAFKKLTEVDQVDLVISMASTPSNAIAPLAEQAKVPLIAWANDPKIAKGRKYVILAEQSALSEGKLVAQKVVENDYKNIAVISAAGDYQQTVVDGFIAELPEELIVMREEVVVDEKDFKPLLLKAKKKGAGALAMCLHPGQFGVLAKQAKQLGITAPLFGCNVLRDSNELTISEGALEGAWYISIEVAEAFRKRYRERFGNESVVSGAAIYFELTKLLNELQLGGKSSEEIVSALLGVGTRDGAVGNYEIVTEEELQFFNIQMALKTIEPQA